MRDKRPVHELTTEELEKILAIRRREERMTRFRRYQDEGRTVHIPNAQTMPAPAGKNTSPVQHERAVDVPAPIEPTAYDLTEEAPRFEDDIAEESSLYISSEPEFVDEQPEPVRRLIRVPKGEQTLQQKVLGWALLLVEVAFVSGLAIVLYNAFTGLADIQDTTNRTQAELNAAILQSRVTPSPTPIISAADYIIPGGHTPPNEDGLSQPNLVEIDSHVPEHLRPAVKRQLLDPVPLIIDDSANLPRSLFIPAINVSGATIVSGDNWEALQAGVGYRVSSGLPGSDQNMVLTGHNDIYGEIFRDLHKLREGDEIRVEDNSGRSYLYRVRESYETSPTSVHVMDPKNGAQVTLITCHPYQVDDRRWIVVADLVQ